MGYIYQADVYCDECGDGICNQLLANDPDAPAHPEDESSFDSGDFPKSANVESEESDHPEHCAQCGVFLRNPLTQAGYEYVEDALDNYPLTKHLTDWAEEYGFTCNEADKKWTSDEMRAA